MKAESLKKNEKDYNITLIILGGVVVLSVAV